MSLFYSLAYRFGFTPWEEAATHAPAARQVAALFDREQADRTSPFGRALDLGCGRGYWSLDLARRGWQVTGVDLVARALEAARQRARASGLDVRFVQGDITRLGSLDLGTGFSLFWDFGTIHGLGPDERAAVGRGVSALAAPDATMLILAWAPGRRGPLPRGASRGDIEAAFPHWTITHEEAFDATGLPPPLRKVDPHVFRLSRAP